MATMTVMFEVEAADSGPVMSALAPCMGVLRNFCMEAKETEPAKPKRACPKRGSKVEDTIIAALTNAAEKKLPMGTLGEALAKIGLNANSASPGVTSLERAGKVRRGPNREVELVQ